MQVKVQETAVVKIGTRVLATEKLYLKVPRKGMNTLDLILRESPYRLFLSLEKAMATRILPGRIAACSSGKTRRGERDVGSEKDPQDARGEDGEDERSGKCMAPRAG